MREPVQFRRLGLVLEDTGWKPVPHRITGWKPVPHS